METTQSITISLDLANKIIDALDDMTSISEKRKIHYELCNLVENAELGQLTPATLAAFNEEVFLLQEENAALRHELLIQSRIDRECEGN